MITCLSLLGSRLQGLEDCLESLRLQRFRREKSHICSWPGAAGRRIDRPICLGRGCQSPASVAVCPAGPCRAPHRGDDRPTLTLRKCRTCHKCPISVLPFVLRGYCIAQKCGMVRRRPNQLRSKLTPSNVGGKYGDPENRSRRWEQSCLREFWSLLLFFYSP